MTRYVASRTPGDVLLPAFSIDPDQVPRTPSPWDDEFEGPLAGNWTNMDTGATFSYDVNKTVPSALWLSAPHQGDNVGHSFGFYRPSPPIPFTVTAKIAGSTADMTQATDLMVFVGEATPGKFMAAQLDQDTPSVLVPGSALWATPTSWTATTLLTGTPGYALDRPCFVRIIVASATSVTTQWSQTGLLWLTIRSAENPAFTIGSIGVAMHNGASGGTQMTGGFDWIRVTLP